MADHVPSFIHHAEWKINGNEKRTGKPGKRCALAFRFERAFHGWACNLRRDQLTARLFHTRGWAFVGRNPAKTSGGEKSPQPVEVKPEKENKDGIA